MKQIAFASIAAGILSSAPSHGAAIVVSGWLTNVNGDDSPYEYAQFVATQDIDFALTPYTVVWNDVGLVGSTGSANFSDGWSGGSLLSYAFQLNVGSVLRGETFYLGGAAQRIAGPGSTSFAGEKWLRVIDTSASPGDGLGIQDSTGVFGNGGPNADGIAIFAGLSGAITATSVPLEAVFFGVSVGTAHPATGGFKAADNDHYTSGGVFGDAGNSFLFPDLAQNQFQRLTGTYNWATASWEAPRAGSVVTLSSGSQVSAIATGIVLVPEPATGLLLLAGAFLAGRRRRS